MDQVHTRAAARDHGRIARAHGGETVRPVVLIVLAIGIIAVIAGTFAAGSAGLVPDGDVPRLIYLLLFLILIAGGATFRGGLGSAPAMVRNAVIWLVILFAGMGVYIWFVHPGG